MARRSAAPCRRPPTDEMVWGRAVALLVALEAVSAGKADRVSCSWNGKLVDVEGAPAFLLMG